MAPATTSVSPAVARRHFLLLSLASILPLLLLVTPCLSETSRDTTFEKVHMCSATLSGSESALTKSSLHCGLKCAGRRTCTGFSYHDDGTCHLHEADLLTSDGLTCIQTVTDSVVHFLKATTTSPSIQCQNGGQVINDGQACRCYNGYVGDFCERLMIDCTEALRSGHYPEGMSGLYWALPFHSDGPVELQCDTGVHHFVLHRWVGSVTFNVTMTSYVSGFGNASIDYWLGLERLHLLTSNDFNYNLGIQVSNHSNKPFYQHYYFNFKVNGKDKGYAMTFTFHQPGGPPANPMGDCLTPLKDQPFSTYDDDNDGNSSRNCAADYGGGWWYDSQCSQCNLMGELRWFSTTRVAGSVSEVFWAPGLEPQDFSPTGVSMFLYRD